MDVIEVLQQEKKKIERTIRTATARLEKLPKGRVRVFDKYGGQYYVLNPNTNKWEYCSKAKEALVKEYVQYQYEEKVLELSKVQLKTINNFLFNFDNCYIEKYQSSINALRLKLINKHVSSDEEYISKWQNNSYRKNSYEIRNSYLTHKGDFVRSKSEVIIADHLYMANIPYKYEHPCQLTDGIVYPDFTILDVKNKCEIILEHFGRMDDVEYVNKNFIPKMRRYLENGYVLGKNFIATFETSEHPLNISNLDLLLQKTLSN